MPTLYPRTMVTRTPEVERVIAQGRSLWPGVSDGMVLVRLAQRALEAPRRSALMPMIRGGRPITTEEVGQILADDLY